SSCTREGHSRHQYPRFQSRCVRGRGGHGVSRGDGGGRTVRRSRRVLATGAAIAAGPRGIGLTLLMLTPELAGRADLREGCPYGKAEKVHAGVPSGGGGAGAGYGSADRARGRGDRRGCATAGSLGPA